jgi:adenylate cyclase
MPIVTFQPSHRTLEVEKGISLYDAAIQVGLPVASSCSAEFICGKCNMQVIDGARNLSEQTESERKLLRREKRAETDRVSCQTFVNGDCTVTTKYW